ncbi:hypothetical protein O6H91_11G092400 [Diphasiastrum complanatum]|uniref:Uncharacterized protein n=1 Tax=Diphasiastrum complanatum TaxID=34168 RepID=A0ACC2CBM6_DIPCM|nr:hypothetical protein O6H91_11G092400 [Diphasiastrum complanatum]
MAAEDVQGLGFLDKKIQGSSPLSLHEYAKKNNVRFFLISFVDLLGVLRSKLVPSNAIRDMEVAGAGFAGYAAHFDMTAAYPDMFAIPDPASIILLPWKDGVAWVASDLYMHGALVKQAPRQVLKAQVERAQEKGYILKTGVECEFFLLSSASDCSLSDVNDKAVKPCYEQDANGQFEINWEYDDCLITADRHVFFKFMVKSIAEKHGFKATFMPKPFLQRTGNGAHCHASLWDASGTINLFHDNTGDLGLSKLAYEFVGGILANAKALTAFLNPTVNSYKRIDGRTTTSGSSWAPCTISYTGNNRTHMLRIPDAGRFELRLPDGAVNPYLLQAAILACGLQGIDNHMDPGPRCDWNGHMPPEGAKKLQTLPTSLIDALQNLAASKTLKTDLGDDFVESYLKLQMERWKSYTSHLSQWEIDNTLDC